MKRIIFILSLVLSMSFVTGTAYSQNRKSARLHPKWMQKTPKPSNHTFTYKVETAISESLDDAREKCFAQLLAKTGYQNMKVYSESLSHENVEQFWTDGKLQEKINYSSKTETNTLSDAVTLHVEEIDEYWETDRFGRFHLTKLYASSEPDKKADFDEVELTKRYGARGLIRSAIIPGWGQFYKGDNLKGGLILGGCAVAAAGIIFTECERSDYDTKIKQTSVTSQKRDYINKRDNFETARNICIGAAAAIYVYNLIDAITAPGATRVVTKKKSSYSYSFAPVLMHDGSAGFTAALTF